jgi:hypothetical protein
MADIKFSQFTNAPTPNANSYFVGYNSVTNINSRTTLTDLITAIGAPSGSGTTNFVTKWSGTNSLGDSLFYSDASVAKTIYGGADKGLFLDFANQFYNLTANGSLGLQIINNKVEVGDFNGYGNITIFSIDDSYQIMKTQSSGADKGLYIDFANNIFALGIPESGNFNIDNIFGLKLNYSNGTIVLGDEAGLYNYAQIIIDSANQIIKTNNGADKGLYLNFAANQYSFGDYDGAINGTTLTVNDATQVINLFSPRVQYTGQDSATISAFTGNTAGQVAYNSDLNSFQYYNGSAWAAVAPKTTYMMTGVFTNMFGGDPGGLNKDILDWVGSSPAASHSSALPILQNCRITAAGFKWISSTPIGTIGAGDSWTIQVFKMINPLTASTTADGNFTLVGSLNITLTSANSGTTPGVFSSGLNLTLNAGDIIRIAGVETGTIATSTEEAQLTVLFELI